jgi:nitrous oxide reductase accessory protein NosL
MNQCCKSSILHKLPILFTVLVVYLFQACQKEEDLTPVELNAEITHVSEFGKADGSIILSVTGGKAPFFILGQQVIPQKILQEYRQAFTRFL